MKQRTVHALVASILLAFTLSAAAASEEKFSREIAAPPGGKIVVDVDFGTIDVSPGTDDKVALEAFRLIDFGDKAREKAYFEAAPITVTIDANTVTVRMHASREQSAIWSNHTRLDARYTIRVPKNFSADLNTGGGAIAAAHLNGDVRANSGGGDLRLSHLHGAVSAQSGGGGIRLEECNGRLEIGTGGGDIVLTDGDGKLRARTGGGRIEVHNFKGNTDVDSGGGQLTLERIDGAITAETSGGSIATSVAAGGALQSITLESSGGNIDLALPLAAAADITADTEAGGVTTDLPLEIIKRDEEHLRGKLNGGGASVLLRTTGGSIRITSTGTLAAAR
jgi:hypothetical protein